MIGLHHKYKRFKEWEKQPHQVAPLSDEHHECATCGTHFEGNYCPRCGQSARIGRYSFKKAFLLFLDVWGIGNRGMFRSLRDLILRPGYMIRDYLRGMQMAYFPPFKLFFLLIALWLLVDTGMNIQGINRDKQNKQETEEILTQVVPKNMTQEEDEKDKEFDAKVSGRINTFIETHSSAVILASLLLFSLPLYLLFRHSPAIPDLRFSECFVAMVYITDMIIIYYIIPSLLCFSVKAEIVYDLLAILLVIIPIKQLSGYNYWSTFWRLLAALIPFVIVWVLTISLVTVTMYLISK
ncbi:MAG: DUF3667 domain-containing protein [Prevotella sp.]|nr:DUF3667 domain-containing protein [Prevotella sp.]